MTAAPVRTAAAVVVQLEAVVGAAEQALALLGIAVLSAAAAAAVAAVHRWYTREPVGDGVAVLFGLSAAALYLNVRAALGAVVAGETELLAASAVVFNLVALAVALFAAPVGKRVGDRLVGTVSGFHRTADLEASVSGFVATVGRATAVTLPETVADMEGYEPVSDAVKERLAGTTYVFGRRPTGDALREKLVARIKAEDGVAHVDLDLDGDAVTHLAVGARSPGLGHTLAPGTAVVAVEADPPVGASAGDLVQVWTAPADPADGSATAADPSAGAAGASPERVATAELRAVDGDVVTLACDAADAARLAGGRFRLLTLPTQPSPDREFASLLRSADETMGVATVADGSDLVGTTVGDVDATVVAVRDTDGRLQAIPSRGHALAAGETVFAVARPGRLRQLQAAAGESANHGARDGTGAGTAGDPPA